jgi:hypothetical protein
MNEPKIHDAEAMLGRDEPNWIGIEADIKACRETYEALPMSDKCRHWAETLSHLSIGRGAHDFLLEMADWLERENYKTRDPEYTEDLRKALNDVVRTNLLLESKAEEDAHEIIDTLTPILPRMADSPLHAAQMAATEEAGGTCLT